MYPLDSFIPCTASSSLSNVFPSCQFPKGKLQYSKMIIQNEPNSKNKHSALTTIVMTPSFPTFSIAFDIKSPISFSPFAEMVATWFTRGKWKYACLVEFFQVKCKAVLHSHKYWYRITMMIGGCLLQQMQVTIMEKGTRWTSINVAHDGVEWSK